MTDIKIIVQKFLDTSFKKGKYLNHFLPKLANACIS